MKNSTKHIILDIGGVLLEFDFQKVAENLKKLSPHDTEIITEVLLGPDKNRFETGKMSDHKFYRNIVRRLEVELSYQRFCELWCDLFVENTAMSSLVGMLEQTYTIIIASNTNTLHYNHITKHFPYIQKIQHKALSYEMGMLKDNPQFFEHLLRKFRLQPPETLLIDDTLGNVEAAEKVGIKGIIYRDYETLLGQLDLLGIPLDV